MRKLADYEPTLNQVMRFIAKDTRFRCRPGLADILAENPRLVIALSHATPLSWVPAMSLLALHAIARGGRERTPMGIMDNVFFHIPIMREIARWLTQSDRPLSYQELSTRFREVGDIDLVLFPEGSNCFFGPGDQIQDFRSPKFVELSIETEVPILLGVHHGSEGWAATLPVPENMIEKLDVLPEFAASFLEKRLRKTGLFSLPLIPKPMDRFEMLCELYKPTLKKADLSEDLDERRSQIKAEAEKVHARMREMLAELRGDDSREIHGFAESGNESESLNLPG